MIVNKLNQNEIWMQINKKNLSVSDTSTQILTNGPKESIFMVK